MCAHGNFMNLEDDRSYHNCGIINLIRLAVRNVDIVIESTREFENDLAKLSEDEKAAAIKKINDCASLFPTHKMRRSFG
jgi:hypothetical protein